MAIPNNYAETELHPRSVLSAKNSVEFARASITMRAQNAIPTALREGNRKCGLWNDEKHSDEQ